MTPANETPEDTTDWFALIFGVVLGLVIGGSLGLSFAPTMVSM